MGWDQDRHISCIELLGWFQKNASLSPMEGEVLKASNASDKLI